MYISAIDKISLRLDGVVWNIHSKEIYLSLTISVNRSEGVIS